MLSLSLSLSTNFPILFSTPLVVGALPSFPSFLCPWVFPLDLFSDLSRSGGESSFSGGFVFGLEFSGGGHSSVVPDLWGWLRFLASLGVSRCSGCFSDPLWLCCLFLQVWWGGSLISRCGGGGRGLWSGICQTRRFCLVRSVMEDGGVLERRARGGCF